MEERRRGVHNQCGHVAVHRIECEICDEDGWDLGCLGCQTAVSEKRLLLMFHFAKEGNVPSEEC